MSKELIERLREAAAQRVASTAMIGADDLIAAADALESLGADRDSWERQASDRLDDVLRVVAERDALAAELKALREQSPAGKLHSDSIDGHVFIPTGGDWSCLGMSLYARPVPARELTDETIQRHWDEACKDTTQTPGWSRHIRFARAIERYLKGEGK